MWLKRRKTPSSDIPKLRDEYARLLQDTLTDLRPLQDAARFSNSAAADVALQTQWQAHQCALRPHAEAGERPCHRRIGARDEDRSLVTAYMEQ